MQEEIHQKFWEQTKKVVRNPKLGYCVEWTGSVDRNGYGRFRFRRGRVMLVDAKAHRYSFELANGYAPKLVEHRCDNPPCVRPEHLQAGNHQSNAIDARDRGLLVHNPKRLSDTEKVEIVRLRDAGMAYPALAEKFGVSYETVRRVLVRAAEA